MNTNNFVVIDMKELWSGILLRVLRDGKIRNMVA